MPFIAWWPGQVPPGIVSTELTAAIDFLPTFCRLAGTEPPEDRTIDGEDLTPLLFGQEGAKSPRDAFFYYHRDDLEAVRSGRWKLHVAKQGEERLELYDLIEDVGETANVASDHPEEVKALLDKLEACRHDLGDALQGVHGADRRPLGRVETPATLTEFDPDCPYLWAEYDTDEAG